MKTISFDFDGVINSYKTGWVQADIIPDEPVEGIDKVLKKLKEKGYNIVVCSSRAKTKVGENAIWQYLARYDMSQYVTSVTSEKVPSVVLVDDRAIQFNGNTENLIKRIENFVPYYKK